MTPKEIKEKARLLYQARQKNGAFWNHKQRSAFLAQVRKLAKKVPPDATNEKEPELASALMYLDSIATRENITLQLAPKRDKPAAPGTMTLGEYTAAATAEIAKTCRFEQVSRTTYKCQECGLKLITSYVGFTLPQRMRQHYLDHKRKEQI